MNVNKLLAYLRKDGWLLLALFLCVMGCLALGSTDAPHDSQEGRIGRVLSSMAGAGQVEVAVYYEDAVPCGAVVVADGARDVAVSLRLSSAVSALLGLEPARIAVYAREGGT